MQTSSGCRRYQKRQKSVRRRRVASFDVGVDRLRNGLLLQCQNIIGQTFWGVDGCRIRKQTKSRGALDASRPEQIQGNPTEGHGG